MWNKKEIEFNYPSAGASEVMADEYKEVNGFCEACDLVSSWFNWASILSQSNDLEIRNHGVSFKMGAMRLYEDLTGRTYQSKIAIPNN